MWTSVLEGRESTARCQKIFIASLVSLGIGAGVTATAFVIRWQTGRILGAEARMVLDQAARQTAEAMENQRQSVALLRDALNAASSLPAPDQAKLVQSTMERSQGLVAVGWLDREDKTQWWIPPAAARTEQISSVSGDALKRARWRNLLGASTVLSLSPEKETSLLVVIQQSGLWAKWRHRILGVFDFKPLWEKRLGPLPIQVVQGGEVLYRSPRWQLEAPGSKSSVLETPLKFAGSEWIFQLQKSAASPRPLAWLGGLLAMGFLLALLSAAAMIWGVGRLRHLALTDDLTGLYNRRYFLERWEEEVERAKRYRRALSCLIIDVNGFKQINDRFGHPMGDRLLRQIARELKGRLRRTDLLARYGGDEFIIALPETDQAKAEAAAAKLRCLSVEEGVRVPVHLSVGCAQLQAEDSPEEVIRRADADLYASRRSRHEAGSLVLVFEKAS